MEEKDTTQTEVSNETNEKEYDDVWNENISFDDLKNEKVETDEHKEKTIEDILDEKPSEKKWSIVLDRPLKYRGKEVFPQTVEELIELAQKGLDYSFKMNKIRPYRDLINFIETNNISPEQAMNKISGNIDKVPTEPHTNDVSQTENTSIDYTGHIMENILNHYSRIDSILAKKIFDTYESIDPQFKVELVNGNALQAFANSVANGEFENLYPEVVKFKSNNPFIGWIEAYKTVGSSSVKDRDVKENNVEDIKSIKQKQHPKNKTIEEQYNDIWDNGKINTVEDLEKILIEGV